MPFTAESVWNKQLGDVEYEASGSNLAGLAVGFSTWLEPDNTSTPVYSTDANSEKVALLCGGDTWLQLASGAWQNIGNSEAVEAEIRSICDTSFPEFHPYVTVGGAEPTLPSEYDPIENDPHGFFFYVPPTPVLRLVATATWSFFSPMVEFWRHTEPSFSPMEQLSARRSKSPIQLLQVMGGRMASKLQ